MRVVLLMDYPIVGGEERKYEAEVHRADYMSKINSLYSRYPKCLTLMVINHPHSKVWKSILRNIVRCLSVKWQIMSPS
jgi:hypothetical protein